MATNLVSKQSTTNNPNHEVCAKAPGQIPGNSHVAAMYAKAQTEAEQQLHSNRTSLAEARNRILELKARGNVRIDQLDAVEERSDRLEAIHVKTLAEAD